MPDSAKIEFDGSMIENWYHTIELGPDLATQGIFDLRPYVHHHGLPERMDGMRALDVGTQDGFWAFEMERRGATVTALNHPLGGQDRPPRMRHLPPVPGQSGRFHLAKAILGSRVEHVSLNVTDRALEDLGKFDVVFAASVLPHVSDQVLALERLASVCRGLLISAEAYDVPLSSLPFPAGRYEGHTTMRDKAPDGGGETYWWCYWLPNLPAWKEMIWTAGFEEVELHSRFMLSSKWDLEAHYAVHHARLEG